MDNSFREQRAESTLIKLRSYIIGKCGKCTDGFVIKGNDSTSLKNALYSITQPCECYKRYKKYSQYLISGIQKEFWDFKDKKLNIEDSVQKILDRYLKNLETAYDKGMGILFLGNPEGLSKPNSGTGKSSAGIKILLNALELKKTIHYITLHSYFNLVYRSKQDQEIIPLIDEIENVDFLLIDEVGKNFKRDAFNKLVASETGYVISKFEDLIRDRSSKLLPTILITNMNKRELFDAYGTSVMDIMVNTMIEIVMTGTSYRKQKFLDLKKEVGTEL